MLHLGTPRPGAGQERATKTRTQVLLDWSRRFEALGAAARDPRLQAFYAQGARAGDTPLADVPLLAMDFETTGLDPSRDEIVSIGIVPMTLARIQSSASRHWVVRPRGVLNAESVTFHAITHAQIEDAPDLGAILDELLPALAGRVVVVHCAAIERAFLDAALKARLGEGIEFPVIDTMALEARLHRGNKASLFSGIFARLFERNVAPLSIRLADSRARYHLPRYRAHHALTDALATAELLQAQIAHRFKPDTRLEEVWS